MTNLQLKRFCLARISSRKFPPPPVKFLPPPGGLKEGPNNTQFKIFNGLISV